MHIHKGPLPGPWPGRWLAQLFPLDVCIIQKGLKNYHLAAGPLAAWAMAPPYAFCPFLTPFSFDLNENPKKETSLKENKRKTLISSTLAKKIEQSRKSKNQK